MTDDDLKEQVKDRFWKFFLKLGLPEKCINAYMSSLTGFMVDVDTYNDHERPMIYINCDGHWFAPSDDNYGTHPNITPAVVMESIYRKIVGQLHCKLFEHGDNFSDWKDRGQIVCFFQGQREKILEALDSAFIEYTQVHQGLVEQANTLEKAIELSHRFIQDERSEFFQKIIKGLGREGPILMDRMREFAQKYHRAPDDPSDIEAIRLAESICNLCEKGHSASQFHEAIQLLGLGTRGEKPLGFSSS